jgi:two-component system sensor histidine kinase TctE
LRNPVAAIQAQAEAALTASSDSGRTARLEDLAQAARQLSRMSHQLLNFDIANEGRDDDLQPPSDLTALVADVARRHVPRALKAHVDIELEPATQLLPVAGNRVMLEEAIDNLIDNSLKYGCAQGGRLSLVVERMGDMAALTVADDGPGIPPEASEQVFDRFVRLSEDSDGGCGLGLSIVRAIVQRAGGDVGIIAVKKGCTVRLKLPIAQPEKNVQKPRMGSIAAE